MKKTIITIILFFPFLCNSQKNDSTYLKQLDKLNESFRANFFDKRKTIEIQKEVLQLSNKYKDDSNKVISLSYIGNVFFRLKEYKKSIKYLQQAVDLYNSKNNLTQKELEVLRSAQLHKIRALLTLGENYLKLGKVDVSINFYNESKKLAKDKEDIFDIVQSEVLINQLKLLIGDNEEILKNRIDVHKMFNDSTEYYAISNGLKVDYLSNIAKAYAGLKEIDSAVYVISLVKDKHHELFKIKKEVLIAQGYIYLKDSPSKALDYFKLAREEFLKYDSIAGQNSYSFEISSSYYKLKNYKRAYEELNNSIMAKDFHKESVFQKVKSYKLMAKIQERLNNSSAANKNYQQFISLLNEIESSKKIIINGIHNKEIEQLENQKQNKERYIIILVFLLTLFLIAFVIYSKNQRALNKKKFDILMGNLESFKKDEEKSKENPKTVEKLVKEINPKVIDTILKGLNKLEQQQYFLNTNFNATNVAKKIKTNTTYLSKVVNVHFNKSFNQYTTELRIEYALKRLKSDVLFRKYSIQSIANELGFKSKESFNKAFKKETGVLPSYFIEQLERKV